MTDEELLAGLRRLFETRDPSDGLDRSDGYGSDYVVDRLELVTGDDGFDTLEVVVAIGPDRAVSRLLFDRSWRRDSGLDDVMAYAAYVIAKWAESRVDEVRTTVGSGSTAEGNDDLEAVLRRTYANVNVTGHGSYEVVDEDGEVFVVHVTPPEWRRFVAGRPDPLAELEERIATRWDDESHIVYFRDGLHRSIRAELPPVRSMLLRDASVPDEVV
ncbi:hypothetical protein [Aeromicrobium stalagmiti]|uniref:hypothetical protein n=1 Tax=Aeromicrobium stalagmiti TaxID=2738988 RepID=UPI00156918BF|nr:hypothetical protein [Aeromicrobium stalagmiti]NRQ50157.1 hypothetical protein [Aeromicrobium stalagmiti]